ncbi:MAG: spore coat protein [Firmicutes bacterium]|nr:spore coat protein [Bacillota bacterium]
MPITQKEALWLNEILNGHAAAIDRLLVDANAVQDPQLRGILERHLRVDQQHYNTLRNFLAQNGQVSGQAPDFNYTGQYGGGFGQQGWNPQAGMQPFQSSEFRDHRSSDRSIAVDQLEHCKWHASQTLQAGLEAATPQVRQAFLGMCKDHADMAYELFQYLHAHNWYQVPAVQSELMRPAAQAYPAMSGVPGF